MMEKLDDEKPPVLPCSSPSTEGEKPPLETPLTYRDWREDAPSRQTLVRQGIWAGLISLLTVFACGAVWVMSNLRVGPPPYGPIHWEGPSVCFTVALAGLAAWAIVAWRREIRTVAIGIAIGLCVGLLCEGVCFMI